MQFKSFKGGEYRATSTEGVLYRVRKLDADVFAAERKVDAGWETLGSGSTRSEAEMVANTIASAPPVVETVGTISEGQTSWEYVAPEGPRQASIEEATEVAEVVKPKRAKKTQQERLDARVAAAPVPTGEQIIASAKAALAETPRKTKVTRSFNDPDLVKVPGQHGYKIDPLTGRKVWRASGASHNEYMRARRARLRAEKAAAQG